MCGIVGYIGGKEAAPVLIKGLKQLEYRGYDSAGIAILDGARDVKLLRAKGRVEELEKKLPKKLHGHAGIAHTRWATHGEPSEKNAHPHSDCHNRIFVCHNGIIENYKELKDELIKDGHKFKSDTDTEVLPHLMEKNLRYGPELAVAKSLRAVKGTYGLTVIFADYPDKIIAARNSSPLVIGLGNKERLIASDACALLDLTRNVIYMNDGELAVVTSGKIKLLNLLRFQDQKISKLKNLNISARKEKLYRNVNNIQKNGYRHFMLKEIFEQPESILNGLRGRLVRKEGTVKLGGLESVKNQLKRINRIIITGCGTAYLAGAIGKLIIEELSGIHCEVELASELRYRDFFLRQPERENLAMVAISQSGETADTLAVLRKFKENSIPTLGIVNAVGSTIARETDAGVYNHAGSEIGVASTKAFTSQLTVLALLAVFLGRQNGKLPLSAGKAIIGEIEKLPALVKETLRQRKRIKKLAEHYKNYNNFLYIGRKYNFPVACEGALKLKEISYIHAEGYSAGELKHGAIAMIDRAFPVVAIAPANVLPLSGKKETEESAYKKTISNIEEVKARHGKIIAITTEGNNEIEHIANDWLYIPKTLEILTPILSVIPLQLLAYYIGVERGNDIDKPRNLAKSVTVE